MYFYTINYNLETYVGKYFYAQDRKILHRSKLYRIKIHIFPSQALLLMYLSKSLHKREHTIDKVWTFFCINNAFTHRPSKGQT